MGACEKVLEQRRLQVSTSMNNSLNFVSWVDFESDKESSCQQKLIMNTKISNKSTNVQLRK